MLTRNVGIERGPNGECPELTISRPIRDFLRDAKATLAALPVYTKDSLGYQEVIHQEGLVYFKTDRDGLTLLAHNRVRLTAVRIDHVPEQERMLAVSSSEFILLCDRLEVLADRDSKESVRLSVYKNRIGVTAGVSRYELLSKISTWRKFTRKNWDTLSQGTYCGEVDVNVSEVERAISRLEKNKPILLEAVQYEDEGYISLEVAQKSSRIASVFAEGSAFTRLPFDYNYLKDSFEKCPYQKIKIKHDTKNNALYLEAGNGRFIHILAHMRLDFLS